jgi:cytochrome P450
MSMSKPDIDIMSPEAIADPYGYFAELREQHPVVWDERHRSWILTRHEHISTALKDPRFSSDRIAPFIERKLSSPDTDPLVRQAFDVLSDWLVFNDPPKHKRLRALVHKAFTPRAVAGMRDRIDVLCTELLEPLPRTGSFDIKRDFADPLPAIVIAQMLGVPPEDRDRFKGWSANVAAIVSAGLDDPDRYHNAAVGMDELARYCYELVERNREQPADNLISGLLQAQEDDQTLSDAEVVATCTLLLFAGHETTANFIANSLLALLRNPEQLAALRDGEADDRAAVEELLRYDGPGKAMARVMREDCEVDGQLLRAGQRVFLVLASANRDPRIFDAPDELRLARDPKDHVAFGKGFHFCLGASLARLESAVVIPRALRAFPDMTLTDATLRWQPVFLARGLEALPVRVGAATRPASAGSTPHPEVTTQ